jgi:hypothetical protein
MKIAALWNWLGWQSFLTARAVKKKDDYDSEKET